MTLRQLFFSVMFVTSNIVLMGAAEAEVILIDDFAVGEVNAGEQVWNGGGETSPERVIQFEQAGLDPDHVLGGNRKVTVALTQPPEQGFATVLIGGDESVFEFSSTEKVDGIELKYRPEVPLNLADPNTKIFADFTGDFVFGFGFGGGGLGFINNQPGVGMVSVSDLNVSPEDLEAVDDIRFLFAFGTQMQLNDLRIVVPEPGTSVLLFFGVSCIPLRRWL